MLFYIDCIFSINNLVDWYEFVTNAGFSLSIAYLGIFIVSFYAEHKMQIDRS